MMDLGRYLFSIVVVADTHMNEVEYGSSSPYECNRIANARTRYVIERLNQIDPALTIHLGDLIHPVPSMPTYAQAAGNFKALTAALRSRLHLVPGNHDVGDKPVAWAPAGIVNDEALARWREHFGDHYYAFDFRGLHIVVLDAQIINSGLHAEAEQRGWLERDLAAHAGQRTFLCLHYPPYVSDPDESESYDNIAEPGRGWLLGLIETYKPEAVFCGHVHNFWYNRHGASDCYILPSTAFVRQDYSELARVAPVDGSGRDEKEKLGFFVVRIHERGHVCHVERTYGVSLDPGQPEPPGGRRPRAHRDRSRAAAPSATATTMTGSVGRSSRSSGSRSGTGTGAAAGPTGPKGSSVGRAEGRAGDGSENRVEGDGRPAASGAVGGPGAGAGGAGSPGGDVGGAGTAGPGAGGW
jgi:predicted phosphodiesterase